MLVGREFLVCGERWAFDPWGNHVYPPDPEPYDPCWCHSGLKFKFCHRSRDKESPLSTEELIRDWEQSENLSLCFHPGAPVGCSSKIVDAHVVQRNGGGLRAIARDGKVYGFKLHPIFLIKRDGHLVPELIGTGRASTFRGFCEVHDAALFKPAEVRSFEGKPEQLLLLNFRAITRRVHSGRVGLRQTPYLLKADRGRSRNEQRQMFAMAEHYRFETETGLQNIEAVKAIYDDAILSNRYDVNGLTIWFNAAPEFMCSSIVEVDYDFAGRPVTPVNSPAHLCFYTLAIPGGGWAAVWSWFGSNPAAERLAASFLRLSHDRMASAVMQYAFEYIDNIFFGPDWWEARTQSERDKVIARMSAHVQPFSVRGAEALLDDQLRLTSCKYTHSEVAGDWWR
jgi:hypothetical protein